MKVPPVIEPMLREGWTPRMAIDQYFYQDLPRAIRLSMMMCHWTGPPEGYRWGDPLHHQWGRKPSFHLRTPPMPYGNNSPYWCGGCPLCGCEVYALGWHEPWGKQDRRASWHAACVVTWRFMTKPADFICTAPGHEADHIVPLWRAYRMHRETDPWPICLRWWLPGNLQSIPSSQHVEKTRRENAELTRLRRLENQ